MNTSTIQETYIPPEIFGIIVQFLEGVKDCLTLMRLSKGIRNYLRNEFPEACANVLFNAKPSNRAIAGMYRLAFDHLLHRVYPHVHRLGLDMFKKTALFEKLEAKNTFPNIRDLRLYRVQTNGYENDGPIEWSLNFIKENFFLDKLTCFGLELEYRGRGARPKCGDEIIEIVKYRMISLEGLYLKNVAYFKQFLPLPSGLKILSLDKCNMGVNDGSWGTRDKFDLMFMSMGRSLGEHSKLAEFSVTDTDLYDARMFASPHLRKLRILRGDITKSREFVKQLQCRMKCAEDEDDDDDRCVLGRLHTLQLCCSISSYWSSYQPLESQRLDFALLSNLSGQLHIGKCTLPIRDEDLARVPNKHLLRELILSELDDVAGGTIAKFHNVRRMDLEKCGKVDDEAFRNKKRVAVLRVWECGNVRGSTFYRMQNLRELRVGLCPRVENSSIQKLARSSKLELLQIEMENYTPEVGVKWLGFDKLEELEMRRIGISEESLKAMPALLRVRYVDCKTFRSAMSMKNLFNRRKYKVNVQVIEEEDEE